MLRDVLELLHLHFGDADLTLLAFIIDNSTVVAFKLIDIPLVLQYRLLGKAQAEQLVTSTFDHFLKL